MTIKAVMSDNGNCYIARDYRALHRLGIKHLRIRAVRAPTAKRND